MEEMLTKAHAPIITAFLAVISLTQTQPTQALSFKDPDVLARAGTSLLISNVRRQGAVVPSDINDPVVTSPNFLPLCGNGRIDTKADYAAYYKSSKHPPLNVRINQLLPGLVIPGTDMTVLINITIAADEECDDGNRLDFDGCSADCMHMDLWTSACELALDRSMRLESIIHDPVRNAILVSALDGLYILRTELGSDVVRTALVAPKSFPVSNIFRRAGSIILYSSYDQSLWQLPDGESEITFVRRFPELESIKNTYYKIDSHNGEDGSIVVNDFRRMVYIKNLDSAYTPCDFGGFQPRCTHIQGMGSNKNFNCGLISVEIGEGVCNVLTRFTLNDDSNIWADLFDATSVTSSNFKLNNRFTLGDATGNFEVPGQLPNLAFWGTGIEGYHPMGGFIEASIGNPRKLWSANPSSTIPYFTGDPAVLDFIKDSKAGCGLDRCAFDNLPGYDIAQLNPLKNVVSKRTWNDILQDLVNTEAAKAPALSSLAGLWFDKQRYSKVFNAFMDIYQLEIMPVMVLSMIKHPVTHNIWALRSDRLIEVSKSGVQLRRADGTCIPSGVALCPRCQWAPNGSPCRPCSQSDVNSWSWNAVCKACSNSRRLLADETDATITFVLKGDITEVSKVWPQYTVDPATSLITVNVVSPDSVASMQYIKTRLLSMKDIQVITAPHVVVSVGGGSGAVDNTGVILAAVLTPSLVLAFAVGLYFYMRRSETKYRVVPVNTPP